MLRSALTIELVLNPGAAVEVFFIFDVNLLQAVLRFLFVRRILGVIGVLYFSRDVW